MNEQNNIKLILAVQPKVGWHVFKYVKHIKMGRQTPVFVLRQI